MEPRDGSMFWSLLHYALVLKSYTICPLVKFIIGYALFTTTAILATVLYNLRYQVYNQDLKLKPEKCKNRIIIITGAGSGIGLALAHHFHKKGFVIVACCYSKDEPGYKELTDTKGSAQEARPTSMHLLTLDVRSQSSIDSCYAFVRELLDEQPHLRLHALMNVAGVGLLQRFQWVPRATIRSMIEVNLVGPILMTRQFLHLLMKRPGGRVVNVASPLGIFPAEMTSVYGPTKAGLTHFTSVLEADTARYGLRAVTIQPGNLIRNTSIINTSLAEKLDTAMVELNDDERRLYEIEMRHHLRLMHEMERARNSKRYNLELSTSGSLRSNVSKLLMLLGGGISTFRLNESKSFIQSFDNAIRLKDPPREMFAGNIFFVVLVGSLFQWLSRTLIRDVYLNINRRLRRSAMLGGFERLEGNFITGLLKLL